MTWRFLSLSRRFRLGLAATLLLGLGWGGFERFVHSDGFRERVREAMVGELERALGGTVSIDEFRSGNSRLSFDLVGLEIRARDSARMPPLLVVPEASIQLGWTTLLGMQASLESLSVNDPVVHLVVGEGGTSNIPTSAGDGELPRLAIDQFEVNGGSVVLNGEEYGAHFGGSVSDFRTHYDPIREAFLLEATISDPVWGVGDGLAPAAARAELAVSIGGSGIEIRQAGLYSDDYSFSVHGALAGPGELRFEGTYSAEANIGPFVRSLEGGPSLWSGILRTEGRVEWDLRTARLQCEGRAQGTQIMYAGLEAEAEFNAAYESDGSSVEVTEISGLTLGGEFSGSALVAGSRKDPHFSADGTVSGIQIGAMVDVAGMTRLPWDGVVEAEIEASGSLAGGFETALELAVTPLGAASSLAIEGGGSLRYRSRDGIVTVSSLQLETPNALVSAAGSIGLAGHGEMEIEASMASRQAVERVLAVVQPAATLPLSAPDGRYSFRGSMRGGAGQASEVILDGDFSIEDPVFGDQQWKRIAVTGTLSASGIEVRSGQLTDEQGGFSLHGQLPMQDEGTLSLAVSASDVDAGKLAKASGFGLPIEGSLAMELELSGTLRNPEAQSTINVDAPSLFGERFESLTAEVLYDADGFELRNASLERGESVLQAQASMDPADQSIRFEMETNRWPLDSFAWVQLLAPGTTGAVSFELGGSGLLERPTRPLDALELEGSWVVADLRKDGLDLGQWRGELRSERDRQDIELDWDAAAFGGSVGGHVALLQGDPASYKGSLSFRDLRAERLANLFDLPTGDFQAKIAGQAVFDGAASAEAFELSGTIDDIDARLSNAENAARVTNVFPMRWGITHGALRFDSMHLTGPGADFEIDGLLALTDEAETDLGIEGKVSLAVLQGQFEGLEVGGSADVSMRVHGSLSDPELEGSLELLDASIRSPGFAFGFSDIRGAITFEQGIGKIDGLSAVSGGGTLKLTGIVAYKDSNLEYRLQSTVEDMRVTHPETINSVIDGQLTLSGVGLRSILNGEVLISRMSTRNNISFGDLFAAPAQPVDGRGAIPMLQGMQLNIHVGAVPNLPVETSLVRDIEADLDLDLIGTMANPSMLGSVGITRGEIGILGTHYRITRGDIRFENPIRAEPVLNVELEARIRDVDFALVLSGPSSSLNLTYRSDPPLPFHELVNLVVVGKEPTFDPGIATRRRIEQQSLVQTGADNLLSQAIARPVSQRLQRFFGVSRLKVDPQVGGLEANPNARISTEQQIAEDLTLIYSYDLSSAQQQAIRVEWTPDRKWSFIVTRDQNGVVGSDVLYKVRLP